MPGANPQLKPTDAESNQSISFNSLRNKEATQSASTNRHNVEELENLLSFPIGDQYSDLWDLFNRIDPEVRLRYSQRVAIYLSKSNRISEANKTLALFRSHAESTWTNDFVAAGISAMVRSKEFDAAVATFNRAIELGLSGGVEHIVSDAIKREDWSTSVNTWKTYCQFLQLKQLRTMQLSGVDELLTTEPIKLDRAAEFIRPIEEIDNLGELFIKFEKHHKATSSLSKRSRYPIFDFRQQFAEAALRQGCPPREASKILLAFNDAAMYRRYLEVMLRRLKAGSESKSSLSQLAAIYQKYRQLPDHQIPRGVLKGMFQLYYPQNVGGMEELFRDWQASHGELDRWSFEQYLKLYASRGDVNAVQSLWKRYIVLFPVMLKIPMGYRSMMNVYAQVADVEGAETLLKQMMEEHKVQPDLSTWNMMMKCYMRAGDYDKTMNCFRDISTQFKPDGFTFGHAMAMSAKKGDVETTLELFNKSQALKVKISKEMSMGLIMTYIRGGRLKDAEQICTALAARGATSTLVWNELIYHNGLQGNLTKCYELLQSMKGHGVEVDHQTHEFLLQALVKVNQIQAAYQLLRSACREKLFPVRDEHFAIVMAGATREEDYTMLERLKRDMSKANVESSFNTQVSLTEAAFKKSPTAERTRAMAIEMVSSLKKLRQTEDGRFSSTSNPAELKQYTRSIGRAATILIELREFALAEDLVNTYIGLYPPGFGELSVPSNVTAALMQAYQRDGHDDRVLQLWNQHWSSIVATNSRSSSATIFPAQRYALSRPIVVLAHALRDRNDGKALASQVDAAVSAGFQFTRSAWNSLIQVLTELNQWDSAMRWCESMLMSGWRGWNPPAPPTADDRRRFANPRYLVPSKNTVLALQRNWLRLRRLAAWSASVSADLNDAERKYPLLHQAFTATDYDHLPGAWAAPRQDGAATLARVESINKGANNALKAIPLDELLEMRRELQRELKKQETVQADKKRARGKIVHKRKGNAVFKK